MSAITQLQLQRVMAGALTSKRRIEQVAARRLVSSLSMRGTEEAGLRSLGRDYASLEQRLNDERCFHF